MKIQTGQPVRKENYYLRKKLVEKAWDYIEQGNHILLAAPRRVGKTSLMRYLEDYPRTGYSFIYFDTESINNENEFFRRIVNRLLQTDHISKSKKVLSFLKNNIPNIMKVSLDGVEFSSKERHNYKEMLINILESLEESEQKLIIMLDEFPVTLENIINDESKSAGKQFLSSNREIRQNIEISSKVQFIYTGSIGIENIASSIDSASKINDLTRFQVPPLKENEAINFITKLLESVDYDLDEDLIKYILNKIQWLIPFYIQLTLQEIKNIHREEEPEKITISHIDIAFKEMLKQRNHFDHWHSRLRFSFKGKEYNFAKELLNIISENETISILEISDLSTKYGIVVQYKKVLNSLIYDGYINNENSDSEYRFNSPILKLW